jgi:2-keto-4-pentenoate hydratase/2-oxohepta-3-ene-1,7-dioic acid hydratase in catechol pathway
MKSKEITIFLCFSFFCTIFAPEHRKGYRMKIFAVGMNYAQHNKELDGALYIPEEPVIFTKADSSLLKDGKPFFVPDHLGRVDYETEMVVRICRLGKSIPERFAHRYYDAVTVGIDFTARDLQRRLRDAGQPWDLCKGFDGAAAIGEWIPKEKFLDVQALHFHLDINGRTVQEGCTSDMLFGVDRLISYISQFFTLKTGDMLYTGTPAGVGPVKIDDHLTGYLEDRKVMEFNVK